MHFLAFIEYLAEADTTPLPLATLCKEIEKPLVGKRCATDRFTMCYYQPVMNPS